MSEEIVNNFATFEDFGFTAVNEEELDIVTKATTEASSAQERLDKMFAAIKPLLENLEKDSSKDYIYWPNRIEKINQFQAFLDNIYNGTSQ
jgi:hypothetical protein